MTVKSELLDLQRSSKGKMLHADRIVDWAQKHSHSELHKKFEWDDTVAAREHRLWQARQIIQLHLIDDSGDPLVVSLRFDRAKPGGGYRSVDDVLSSKKLSQMMFDDAIADLQTVRTRYDRVRELVDIWSLVDKIADKKTKRKDKRNGGDDRRARA